MFEKWWKSHSKIQTLDEECKQQLKTIFEECWEDSAQLAREELIHEISEEM